jgi:uncharacterized protein (DUF885 family)
VHASRSLGIGRDATHLTDFSPEGHAALAALFRSTVTELDAAAEPADEAERLGAGFLRDLCEGQLALEESGEAERLVSALAGPPAMVRMSFDVMPAETEEDWERVAARLEAVPRAMAGYRASLVEGLASGHPPSRRLVEAVAHQCSGWTGWFTSFVEGLGEGALRARLEAAAAGAGAAYGELGTWLRERCAREATEVDGVGEERYRLWARAVLGTDLELDEAYRWGQEELARIEAEQVLECERILPGASLPEVVAHLDASPEWVVEGVGRYRTALQELLDEAVDGLAGVEFDIPEELRTCVVGIPPAGTAAAPYYSPPSEDLGQPGTTWFPTLGNDRFPLWAEHTTIYHEAVPGHHLQLGLTRLLPLTRAQRVAGNTAHLEGWALYAERLMDELGWFRTPATRLGFLCAQAFRAARVVVDIGLHTGRDGWDVERAIDVIGRVGGMPRAFAESEVLRYLSWPAQATAYKLGERTWLAGRAAAMAAAGPAFDRRAWHGRALALGGLGLARLEQELRGI